MMQRRGAGAGAFIICSSYSNARSRAPLCSGAPVAGSDAATAGLRWHASKSKPPSSAAAAGMELDGERRVRAALNAVVARSASAAGASPRGYVVGNVRLEELRRLLPDGLAAAPARAAARRHALVAEWLRAFRAQPGHSARAHGEPAVQMLLDAGCVEAAVELAADSAAQAGALAPDIVRRLILLAARGSTPGAPRAAVALWGAWMARGDAGDAE